MKEEKSSVDELRGLLKTEKNSPKVLTEEECMACLNQFFEDTNYYLGDVIYNDHNDEFDVLNQLIKKHFELINEVEILLQEAYENSNKAAAGYDEGWFVGETNAYEKVLNIIKQK